MVATKEELWKYMSDNVFEKEEDIVTIACEEYIEAGYPALEGIINGLMDGMNRASILFEEEEYFVTDLLLCSDAMYAGLDILKPHRKKDENENKVRVIIGVVEGDAHDIGKNLVRIMLEAANFEMYDLGRDVSPQQFVDKAKEIQAQIICLSTLMTTTMEGMRAVIQFLEDAGIRNQIKVIIGGGPISQKFADTIGADGYSSNAVEAVRLAKKLAGLK